MAYQPEKAGILEGGKFKMKIGFTGTREGMTQKQKDIFVEITNRLFITEFHDGNCDGSDLQARDIVLENAKKPLTFHIHPHNKFVRSLSIKNNQLNHKVVIHPVKPPLERNHDIVDDCGEDAIVCCPKGDEIVRSGTWATIRYAKKKSVETGLNIYIIYPDGQTTQINYGGPKCPNCGAKNYVQEPDDEYPFLRCCECGKVWFSD